MPCPRMIERAGVGVDRIRRITPSRRASIRPSPPIIDIRNMNRISSELAPTPKRPSVSGNVAAPTISTVTSSLFPFQTSGGQIAALECGEGEEQSDQRDPEEDEDVDAVEPIRDRLVGRVVVEGGQEPERLERVH